jgi:hypothetical protein
MGGRECAEFASAFGAIADMADLVLARPGHEGPTTEAGNPEDISELHDERQHQRPLRRQYNCMVFPRRCASVAASRRKFANASFGYKALEQ